MDTKEREKLITDAVAEFEVGLRSIHRVRTDRERGQKRGTETMQTGRDEVE
jgi:hypothetical protein